MKNCTGALVVLLLAAVAFVGWREVLSAEEAGQEAAAMRAYTRIFCGTLRDSDRITEARYQLTDITSIRGKAASPFYMPASNRGQFVESGPGSAFWRRAFESGPFEFVVGRRYLVFMVQVKGESGRPVYDRVVRIVDLDETKQEQDALAMYSRSQEAGVVGVGEGSGGVKWLDDWFVGLELGMQAGTLTTEDIARVLGEPDEMRLLNGQQSDGATIEATYRLRWEAQVVVVERSSSREEYSYPKLTFRSRGRRVVSAKQERGGLVINMNVTL